jgi:localization factor PodJL
MTSGVSLNVSTFRPETVDAARRAARRSGLSLEQWINSALLDTAADAGVRIERSFEEEGPREDPLAPVSQRLDALAHRIDRLIRGAPEPVASPAERATSPSSAAIEASLRGIESRLASMGELVPQSRETAERLAGLIGALDSRLEQLNATAAPPSPSEGRIAAVDRALGLRGGGPAAERPRDRWAGLSSALVEISARQRELDTEAVASQDVFRLEQQLQHITKQIEELRTASRANNPAATWGADHARFDRLEEKIFGLAQKLDASDARLGNLGAIERSLGDLTLQLKEVRAEARDEAERAARATAREMLADAAGARPNVDALKHELAELRAGQEEIDHRTHDTLEAVHDTLERLVDRLARIETDARSGARPAPSQSPETRLAPHEPASAPPLPTAPASKPPRERHMIDTDLPGDHPLEPGSGAPRGRPAPSAGVRTAAEPASPASAEPPAKADFIAAARRAAQAAAAESGQQGGGEERPSPGGGEERPSPGGGGAALGQRRRALTIGAGVLLFGLGALQLVANGHVPMFGSTDPGRVETHAATEEIPAPAGGKPLLPTVTDARATAVPEPVVPESTALAPTSRPTATPGTEFLLSPTPDSAIWPVTDSQARNKVAPPAPASSGSRGGDITGSSPKVQGNTSPNAEQPANRRATEASQPLPNAISEPGLRAAAAAGNSAAEYEIATRFGDGRGVPQNFEEAARWLARAADHGLAPAQYRLGSLYEKGQGVKKDLAAAQRLYVAAAR